MAAWIHVDGLDLGSRLLTNVRMEQWAGSSSDESADSGVEASSLVKSPRRLRRDALDGLCRKLLRLAAARIRTEVAIEHEAVKSLKQGGGWVRQSLTAAMGY